MRNSRKSLTQAITAAGLALQRAFAPADQARVGLQLDEDVGPVRIRRERDAEHLHLGDAAPSSRWLRSASAPPAPAACRSAHRRSRTAQARRPRARAARRQRSPRRLRKNSRRFMPHAPCTSPAPSSLTVIPRPGPVGSAAKPSFTTSTTRPPSAARIRRSASASGNGICWMKKLGRLTPPGAAPRRWPPGRRRGTARRRCSRSPRWPPSAGSAMMPLQRRCPAG